ncbi:SAVED domain-containing protein [uncultured Thermomonospora sp.]|uniref:SAVED domain-containing protein n=1 Tax=uncultured Thermomonospora sp. TaxID=671175 RepID=UPI00259B334B|nr:SAVED domain-containing protein [uncultured Thermomonospora sp.]
MTIQDETNAPHLTVVGASDSPVGSPFGRAITDGTVLQIGGGLVTGFGVEAAKSVIVGDPAGRWWFVLLCVLGVALVGVGLWQRARAAAKARVGVVVTAADAGRGAARAARLEEQAEAHCRNTCAVTLKTGLRLPDTKPWPREGVDALADETLKAMAMAERLAARATRINLVPTMPLHVGFRFGARIGHTHAREVVVHSVRQADGVPAYFPATTLRATATSKEPLTVEPPETIDGGDPARAALALDLQGRGEDFRQQVKAACRRHGIGVLLLLRSTTDTLAENQETFTAVVEQACRVWRQAPLPASARNGHHSIFLSGPIAIAIALGARLAAAQPDRWTAYTFDGATGAYEPFPTPPGP